MRSRVGLGVHIVRSPCLSRDDQITVASGPSGPVLASPCLISVAGGRRQCARPLFLSASNIGAARSVKLPPAQARQIWKLPAALGWREGRRPGAALTGFDPAIFNAPSRPEPANLESDKFHMRIRRLVTGSGAKTSPAPPCEPGKKGRSFGKD